MHRRLVAICISALIVFSSTPALPQQQKGVDYSRSPAAPMIGKARELIEAKREYSAALVVLQDAIKLDPKNPFAYQWRGTAYNRMGQYALAIPEFDQALRIDPRLAGALSGRGIARHFLGDSGTGLADLNASIAISSRDARTFYNRGMIYSDVGEQKHAIEDFEKAINLNPAMTDIYGAIGRAHLRLKQYDQAIKAYDEVIKHGGRERPHSGRGNAYLNLGKYDLALADANQAIRFNAGFVEGYMLRARIHLETAKFPEGIADYGKALSLDPKLLGAFLGRARARELARDYANSLIDFEAALAIDQTHGVAIAGRDRIKAKMGTATNTGVPQRGRVALVIGNSRYGVIDNLPNAERDARLVSDGLRRSGFENVEVLINGSRENTLAALASFNRRAAAAEWAVVYYAGHGVELDGNNYLVPVDVQFANDADIPKESIALDHILNAVAGAGRLRLVILDACRENPLVAQIKGKEGSSSGKGLARIEPETGTLVAFATKHGHLATDGAGQNSPFAESLVRRMNSPGLEINQLFRLVHDDVFAATNKVQQPFTYGQLSAQEFYFKPR